MLSCGEKPLRTLPLLKRRRVDFINRRIGELFQERICPAMNGKKK